MGTIQHTSNPESTAAGKSLATFEKWLVATHQRLDNVGAVSLGLLYSDLNIFGDDAERDFQRTVANYPWAYLDHLRSNSVAKQLRVRISSKMVTVSLKWADAAGSLAPRQCLAQNFSRPNTWPACPK